MIDVDCRDEILKMARDITSRRSSKTFTVAEIVHGMVTQGTTCAPDTIRAYIGSRMCINPTNPSASHFQDFRRIRPGLYELV